MTKNKKAKARYLLVGILVVVMLTGCAGSRAYKGKMTEFSYHYGSFFGGYYAYDLVLQGDVVHFTAEGKNGVELSVDKEVDPSVLSELSTVMTDRHVERWDGFSKSDDRVLDGYGFSLAVKYDDERTLIADGYEKYPKDYWEVHDALVRILETVE